MAEKKIGSREFKVGPMTAPDAYKLLCEMIAITGSAAQYLPSMLSAAKKDDAEGSFLADVGAFAACSSMIKEVGVEGFLDFKRKVIESAMVKRPSGAYESVLFDSDFIGDLVSAEKLFEWVLEEQFAPFLKGSEVSGPVALSIMLIRNVFRTLS